MAPASALVIASLPPHPLGSVPLAAEELAALRRQGTVICRRRGRSSEIYELRFRVGGQQRRRYLGVNRAFAQAVAKALAEWQRGRAEEVELRRAATDVAQRMRASRQRLRLPLARLGFRFHGRAIRRTRQSSSRRPPPATP
jgi:hypothetical protein